MVDGMVDGTIDGQVFPAFVEYYDNGMVRVQQWYRRNKIHRDSDLPSSICYYESGNVKSYSWCENGIQYSRSNGLPAYVVLNEDGSTNEEIWQVNGNFSHPDPSHPVKIIYDKGEQMCFYRTRHSSRNILSLTIPITESESPDEFYLKILELSLESLFGTSSQKTWNPLDGISRDLPYNLPLNFPHAHYQNLISLLN